jgi:ABC-type glutathione transport system ATPase component
VTTSPGAQAPVLSIRDLRVSFVTQTRRVAAVNGVSLDVAPGECLAIVGESGSGKSQTFQAALGPLAAQCHDRGSVQVNGREILGSPSPGSGGFAAHRSGLVSQDPMIALTPHLWIEHQLVEVLVGARRFRRRRSARRALAALESVHTAERGRGVAALSARALGGMRQRVALAIAADRSAAGADRR